MSPYHPDLALRTLALEYANLIRQTAGRHGLDRGPAGFCWRRPRRSPLRLAFRDRLPARGRPAADPRPLLQH